MLRLSMDFRARGSRELSDPETEFFGKGRDSCSCAASIKRLITVLWLSRFSVDPDPFEDVEVVEELQLSLCTTSSPTRCRTPSGE